MVIDINMKLEAVTKLDKRNKNTFKKIDDDVMPENCDVIAIFPANLEQSLSRIPDA